MCLFPVTQSTTRISVNVDPPIVSSLIVPECVTCQCPLTVKHILIECTDFRDIRNKYFVPTTMKEVFEQVSMRNVINFIKETHFYNLL